MKTDALMAQIERLVDKAARSEKSDDALKFSQAACNAANAMAQMNHVHTMNTGK